MFYSLYDFPKKIFFLGLVLSCFLGNFGFASLYAQAPVPTTISFIDMTPADPAFGAVMKYAQEGKFEGIITVLGREARLDSALSKVNAGVALCKFLGYSGCSPAKTVELGIYKAIPAADEMLDVATWLSMLAKAHKVPVGQPISKSMWYLGPYLACKSLKCIPDNVNPFDIITKRDLVISAYIYETTFAVKTAEQEMISMEQSLMAMRNTFLDAEATNEAVRKKAWEIIVQSNNVIANSRLESIKSLTLACFAISDLRDGLGDVAMHQQNIKFFVDKAVFALEDVGPFGTDLLRIAGIDVPEVEQPVAVETNITE